MKIGIQIVFFSMSLYSFYILKFTNKNRTIISSLLKIDVIRKVGSVPFLLLNLMKFDQPLNYYTENSTVSLHALRHTSAFVQHQHMGL